MGLVNLETNYPPEIGPRLGMIRTPKKSWGTKKMMNAKVKPRLGGRRKSGCRMRGNVSAKKKQPAVDRRENCRRRGNSSARSNNNESWNDRKKKEGRDSRQRSKHGWQRQKERGNCNLDGKILMLHLVTEVVCSTR